MKKVKDQSFAYRESLKYLYLALFIFSPLYPFILFESILLLERLSYIFHYSIDFIFYIIFLAIANVTTPVIIIFFIRMIVVSKKAQKNKQQEIKIESNTIYLYKKITDTNYSAIPIDQISHASLSPLNNTNSFSPLKADLILRLFVKRRFLLEHKETKSIHPMYTIFQSSMKKEDFSRLCNIFVEESRRCKACQSSYITWHDNVGRCHSCGKTSPLKASDFDWEETNQNASVINKKTC